MEVHPWTKYEIARMRDEERLLRARAAMRALELREASPGEPKAKSTQGAVSLIDRIRRRAAQAKGAPAGSGAV